VEEGHLTEPGTGRPAVTEEEIRRERLLHTIGLFLGPVIFLVLWFVPLGDITPAAHRLAAVMGLTICWWVTEAIPIPVTAVLAPTLGIILKVTSAKDAYAPFADPIVFLFIGSFIIAEAIMIHGLDRRIAYAMLKLRKVGESPGRILLVVGIVTCFVSLWVSNTATTAMMLPICLGILGAVREGPRPGTVAKRVGYGTGLMLVATYSSSIAIATPMGSPPNMICIGMVKELAAYDIGFVKWMFVTGPMMIAMFIVMHYQMEILFPAGVRRFTGVQSYVRRKARELGAWTPGQRNTLIVFCIAVALWTVPGIVLAATREGSGIHSFFFEFDQRVDYKVVAVITSALLFLMPVNWRRGEFTITWDQAVRIDWGTILLFGGGLSLGKMMFDTGLAEALGNAIASFSGAEGVWGITAVAIVVGIIMSEAASNTASASMIIPVMIAIAEAAGVSPIPPALGAAMGASYGFMLPVSTPPNAIVYSSGLVPITQMVRAGVIFDIIGFFLILGGLRLMCPILGMI
jgi:sodium-dependent dicarboxylate transporter 2/3/5